MTTANVLKMAERDGVRVRLGASGNLKASGPREALARWLPELKAMKAAIFATINDDCARCFICGQPGLSWASVRRAKKALGIKAHKEALRDGWSWSLSKGLSISEEAQPFALSPFGRFEPLRDNPNSNSLGEEIEF